MISAPLCGRFMTLLLNQWGLCVKDCASSNGPLFNLRGLSPPLLVLISAHCLAKKEMAKAVLINIRS